MGGSIFEEKLSFKILGVTFSSKLDWGTYTISIAKTASKKIGAFSMNLMKFLSSRLLWISINLQYTHVWNTVVTSVLLPLVATWNC